MLVPQTKAGGIPHRFIEAILEIFVVLGCLGRFGRMLRAVLHGYGGSGIALERLLDGLRRVVGRCCRDFGCHVAAQSGSDIWKLSKKVLLQEAEGSKVVFDKFFVEDKTVVEA